MSSTDRCQSLSAASRAYLLDLARDSIRHGLATGRVLPVALDGFDPELRASRASFVTLYKYDQLRGCIGSLQASRALAEDVAANAYAAAFRDPRFSPVEQAEFDDLEIHISVLTVPEPMNFVSEADLLSQLRPGVDGLILEEGRQRGTFLPSVWEQLPEPTEFLRHLKLKAGLPADHWSEAIRVSRYETEAIPH